MFILKADKDYVDDITIISKSRGVLEELLLSLYEEDMYDWFCTLNDLENRDLKELILMATQRAKRDSELLTINLAVEMSF